MAGMTDDDHETDVADVAYAALIEAGRPDLALRVMFFEADDGRPYLEPMDDGDPLPVTDLALMFKAEGLALLWLDIAKALR